MVGFQQYLHLHSKHQTANLKVPDLGIFSPSLSWAGPATDRPLCLLKTAKCQQALFATAVRFLESPARQCIALAGVW